MTIRDGDTLTMIYVADSGESFVLRYREDQWYEAIREVVSWANHPEIGFSWIDASRTAAKIRDHEEQALNKWQT